MTLDPARAAIRLAVRRELDDQLMPGQTVMVGCSGGADSLALLAATVFEARREAIRVVGVTVDHGLQAGSRDRAAALVAQMAGLGVAETASVRVSVDPGGMGIEAAARQARYEALKELARHFDPLAFFLGHTLDDQAETVLLGLARGSGGRSLAGMRRRTRDQADPGFHFTRPLLGITRAETEAACRADGITWWDDPQNADPGFARSRVRHTVMPVLESELGPGVARALARTADMVREDVDYLDDRAEEILDRAFRDGAIHVAELDGDWRSPLNTRVIRRAAIYAGATESELTRGHVLAVLELLGRRTRVIQLPGHVTAYVEDDLIKFRPTL
ncbi:MAG: tRNA lysidine(34) synthetase TilS [Marmoricola sp.]